MTSTAALLGEGALLTFAGDRRTWVATAYDDDFSGRWVQLAPALPDLQVGQAWGFAYDPANPPWAHIDEVTVVQAAVVPWPSGVES